MWAVPVDGWVTLTTNATPCLRVYSAKFCVLLASRFCQPDGLKAFSWTIHSTFPQFEGHALFADEKEHLGQGVTHIVPSVNTVLPGSNPASR